VSEPSDVSVIDFTSSMVGLVVRGKRGALHAPGVMEQHADCILPDGSPIGFFGEGPNRSGGRSGASSMQSGMNLHGVVYRYEEMRVHRPWYVNVEDARQAGVVSTVLTVDVGTALALAFAEYWRKLFAKPGGFDLLGNNCSTHASDAFVAAGILRDGIPGLDTPNNLYEQLAAKKRGLTASYSGLVGFRRRQGVAGFDVLVV
jgi:hypothetical protein